jgi:hypothetical protein
MRRKAIIPTPIARTRMPMMIPAMAPPLIPDEDLVVALLGDAVADARMSIVEELELRVEEDRELLLLDDVVLVESRDDVDVLVGLREEDVVGGEDVDVVEVVEGTAQ